MFTVEQRDSLCQQLLRVGKDDERIVAGAFVGSLAAGTGDRFSDIDLTFAIADGIRVIDVLDEWTHLLIETDDAIRLVDLERGPTIYRVFLMPHALQLDLSMRPAADFRSGPRFRLMWGTTAPDDPEVATSAPGPLSIDIPAVAGDIFGWGVIYALHSRACIGRNRVLQAEHYVGAVRDLALALACLREGLPPAQARSYDDLSAEARARLDNAHVGSLETSVLREALGASTEALMYEAAEASLPDARRIAERLGDLSSPP